MALRGVIPPLTTPFEHGRVSPARLAENIARYERHGVGGYLVLGSSGEPALLDEEEKRLVLRAAREAIPAGKPLLAGVGLESTRDTIRLARIAADGGADLLLVLTPHYYGDRMDGAALRAHYRAVADAAPLPILLYDVPKFTHLEIPAATVMELSAHPNVAGIKESSSDPARLEALLPAAGPAFQIVCGSHALFLDALDRGVDAAILAVADVLPGAYATVHRLHAAGRRAEAAALHAAVGPLSELVVSRHGVPGIKAALDLLGLHGGEPRPPLLPVSPAIREELRRRLAALEEVGALV